MKVKMMRISTILSRINATSWMEIDIPLSIRFRAKILIELCRASTKVAKWTCRKATFLVKMLAPKMSTEIKEIRSRCIKHLMSKMIRLQMFQITSALVEPGTLSGSKGA